MKDRIRYKGFIGSVNYASEDRVFYGKVEGVKDLMSFEGSTVSELEESFEYMVDEHIKDYHSNSFDDVVRVSHTFAPLGELSTA